MRTRMLVIAVVAALAANVAVMLSDGPATNNARAAGGNVRIVFEAQSLGDLQSIADDSERMLNVTQDVDRLMRNTTLLATNSAPGAAAATEARLRMLDQILAALRRAP
jgi:hypothetical protein